MGRHLILDGFECGSRNLNNLGFIKKLLMRVPEKIGMTKIGGPHLIDYKAGKDIDSGITGTVILAESHIHIHTFPKRKYVAIDIFSCKRFDAKKTAEELKKTFGIGKPRLKIFDRGVEL